MLCDQYRSFHQIHYHWKQTEKAPVLEEGFHSLYPPSLQDLTYEEPIK